MPQSDTPANMLDAAEALKAASPRSTNQGNGLKIDNEFGEYPEVIDAIVHAFTVNKLVPGEIADMLSNMTGVTISGSAVSRWLQQKGYKKVGPKT